MRRLALVAALLALAALPLWAGGSFYVNIGSQILLYAVFALGINVLVGYAGLVSLGHAGLLGIAAYAAARLLNGGYGHLAAVAVALVLTLAAAALFAALALRGSGIGFVMITLAIGQIVWGVAYRWISITNGDNGISVSGRPSPLGLSLASPAHFYWATLAVFSRWRNGEVTVRVDGEEHRGRMHDVIVANGRYLGGGMKMLPDAEPDDGRLDVLLIGDLAKRDLLLTMPKTYRGTHLPHPKATALTGSVVEVDAPEPLPVQLDGEQPGTTPARFELVPQALRLRVPG